MITKVSALSDMKIAWKDIDWTKCYRTVERLQLRIVKAVRAKRWNKIKSLQWILTHSLSAKALAVRKVTENNRGYNKYLKMAGSVEIEIDYRKFELDSEWDGLKGYITNSHLDKNLLIDRYKNLWVIEQAFRMSKTDLRIRPIYHRIRERIEAHITVSFMSYSIIKELERVLKKSKSSLSLQQSMEVTQNMYEIEVMLPGAKTRKNFLLKMDEKQSELYKIINSNF